eukprot:COSAG02_NODE_3602_length_6498_cov_2.647914_3_plen_685_part_00
MGSSSPKGARGGGKSPRSQQQQQFLNPIHTTPIDMAVSDSGDFDQMDPGHDPTELADEPLSQRARDRYQVIFRRYDLDGSGTIDADELQQILEEVGQTVSDHEIVELMKEIDSDNSGEIDFEEFMQAVEKSSSRTFDEMNVAIEEKVFGKQLKQRELLPGEDGYADPYKGCGLLHPDNNRRKIYDMVQLSLLFYTMFEVPLQIAFADEPQPGDLLFAVDLSVWIFFCIDLFVQMHTYYQSGRTGLWVSDSTKLRARYFRTWFIVDFVAVFPVDYILRMLHWHGGAEANGFRMLRLARLLRYLRLLKLMNFSRASALLALFQERAGFSAMTLDFITKVFGLVTLCICFNHLAGCMWLFIGRTYSSRIEPYPDEPIGSWWDDLYGPQIDAGIVVDRWKQYVDAVYLVMVTLTSVGYGDITPVNEEEKWFCYIMMYFTAFVYAYVIGVFADIVANRRSDRNLFDMKMRSVFEFMNHVDAPDDLKQQVKIFYNYRYPRKTLFDEDVIYEELPPKFSTRLVLHRFERTVHHVPFFRKATDECIVAICRSFNGFTAMPGHMILDKGEHNHELIIMEYGNATGLEGAITTNYPAGSFFGEMEFLGLAETSAIAVRADEHCELFSLRYGDIAETLTEYPDVQEQLQEYAVMKKAAMTKLQGLPEGMSEPAYSLRMCKFHSDFHDAGAFVSSH